MITYLPFLFNSLYDFILHYMMSGDEGLFTQKGVDTCISRLINLI